MIDAMFDGSDSRGIRQKDLPKWTADQLVKDSVRYLIALLSGIRIMKKVIRIGDPTDHGGSVTSATSTTSFFGKNVAVVGDSVSCPQQGHTNCVIVEGDPSWSIGGKAVALEGNKVSCGATLISTLGQVSRDYVGSGAATVGAGSVAAVAAAAGALVAGRHWIEFALPAQENYAGMSCTVNFDDGSSKAITFDKNSCARIDSIAKITGVKLEFDGVEDEGGESLTTAILKAMGA
ncbi:PAAR domain-containing protein [Chromobacterium piscinae]|uniref:PAAR domain-containing protein n=1 Tax=Chromobacterium piscinae TaxID=686831 RepID=UPI00320A5A5D